MKRQPEAVRVDAEERMSGRLVSVDRDTPYLLPPSVQEWLPENHLARFVVVIVARVDLGARTRAYRGRGSDAFHPAMLVALVFYGYATGVFSSRKLERETYDLRKRQFRTRYRSFPRLVSPASPSTFIRQGHSQILHESR